MAHIVGADSRVCPQFLLCLPVGFVPLCGQTQGSAPTRRRRPLWSEPNSTFVPAEMG